MKKILLIIGVLISVVSFGQPITPQTGYVGMNQKLNLLGLKAERELGIPVRDTNTAPAYVGELRLKTSDSLVYAGISTTGPMKWISLGRRFTLQQILNNGSTLTQNNTIDLNGHTLTIGDGNSYLYAGESVMELYSENTTTATKYADIFAATGNDYSSAQLLADSAGLTIARIFVGGQGTAGRVFIESTIRDVQIHNLPSTTVGATKWMVTYDTVSRNLEYAEIPDGGGSDDLQDVTDLGNETDNDIISTNNSGFRVQESATDLAQLGKVNGGSGAAAGGYISLKSTGSGAGKALVMPTASWAAGTKTAFLHYNDGDTLATKADIRNAVGTGTLMVSLTDAATITVDASQGNPTGATFKVTLGGNRTIANPTGAVDGQRIFFELTQDGTGTRTVTWGSKYVFSADTPAPTLSTAAGAVDNVGFYYNQTNDKYYVTGTNIGH